MSEILNGYIDTKKQKEFQKTLTSVLSDSRLTPEEAKELLREFDLDKKDLLQVSKEQLQLLKQQF